MEAELEEMCNQIDAVLERFQLSGRVCGGYVVSSSGILFSLNDGTFVRETAVLDEIERVLAAQQIMAAPGVVIVQL